MSTRRNSTFMKIDTRGINVESANYKVGWQDGFKTGLGVGVGLGVIFVCLVWLAVQWIQPLTVG